MTSCTEGEVCPSQGIVGGRARLGQAREEENWMGEA